jgi:hypothetical protein
MANNAFDSDAIPMDAAQLHSEQSVERNVCHELTDLPSRQFSGFYLAQGHEKLCSALE